MRALFARLWSTSRRPRQRPKRRPLSLELLEARRTPAVVMVTATGDDITPNDGMVTLREAITAINAGNDLG